MRETTIARTIVASCRLVRVRLCSRVTLRVRDVLCCMCCFPRACVCMCVRVCMLCVCACCACVHVCTCVHVCACVHAYVCMHAVQVCPYRMCAALYMSVLWMRARVHCHVPVLTQA